jgi:hypothetical protein
MMGGALWLQEFQDRSRMVDRQTRDSRRSMWPLSEIRSCGVILVIPMRCRTFFRRPDDQGPKGGSGVETDPDTSHHRFVAGISR